MLRALALLACLATPLAAQDSRLERLDMGDSARAWEAVGRLELGGRGFCTGALVAPDLVLTAAHCLYDKVTGARLDPARIEFMAGWRNGRAAAYRSVRRAVTHPDYDFAAAVTPERVRNDVALLELYHPIRNTHVTPFETDQRPREGQKIGVVSYARDRSEAPSLQEVCEVLARQGGVLVMSCDVNFGSSGAPVFSFEGGQARIVSVVSAMAEVDGRKVALGTQLLEPLDTLRAALDAGQGVFQEAAPKMLSSGTRRDTGAKFSRP
ncbi:trypsin-like serine peptidase [Roseovarius autotrophicus]|uniref:trypsin-like serine peptidase n=1 Tax=Roseovarius autotrophicus TaxID=2824121 RepID=UPI001A07FDE9|nr:trypsin-like serine protease [Roseovarius autotrophicus]MBE0453586.1 trypsin-like serine protease [Roseovarius sp.]